MNRRRFLHQSSRLLAAGAVAGKTARQSSTTGLATQTTRSLSLALTGDVILTRRVSGLTDPAFAAVRSLLTSADCTFGNCELVIAAVVASRADGERIVADFARLSKGYGVEVTWDGNRGAVRLPG